LSNGFGITAVRTRRQSPRPPAGGRLQGGFRLCYSNLIKMKKYVRFLALFGILAALTGPAGAREAGRIDRPGRAGIPVFGRAGELILIAQDDQGNLSFVAPESAIGPVESAPVVRGAAPLGIAAKAAPSGEIGAAWIRTGRNAVFELVYGRALDGRIVESRTVQATTDALFSPDVDYDEASNPWLAWVQGAEGRQEIVVQDLARGRIWVVNGPEDGSALTPKIVVASAQKAWVIWTGREAGCDQIMAASFLSGSWSRPVPVNRDARFPHMAPAASLDALGRPWVVWSVYDGDDYEIYGSFWTEEGWSGEERISDNGDSDMSPAIALVKGATPVAVWAKTGPAGSSLCASARLDGRWSAETTIVAGEAGPVRSVSVTALGDMVGLSWGAGGRLRSRILDFSEVAAAIRDPAAPEPAPVRPTARIITPKEMYR